MLSLIKKSLIWIVSGTVSVILTACYGSPTECRYWAGQKIRAVDANNTPIPGLYVTHRFSGGGYQGFGYTDENGEVNVHACEADSIKVTVEDVDGEIFGSFDDKTVTVDLAQWFDDDSDENVEIVVMGPGVNPGNSTRTIRLVDTNNAPIPGLLVTSVRDEHSSGYVEYGYTDSAGQMIIGLYGVSSMLLTVEDVDGSQNGSFLRKNIEVHAEGNDDAETVEIIVMDPAGG